MLQSLEHSPSLLSDRDPAPVEVVNADGRAVFVLTCEHAGRHVPARLRDLGIYLVTLAPDACATYSEERHQNPLRAIKGFCRQVATDALIAEIERRI